MQRLAHWYFHLIVQSVDADICYIDPGSAVRGLDALLAKIQESQTKFPGAYFKNDTFLEHHDSGLFHWTMYDAQGTPKVKGSSYGAFGAGGKLRQASGFFKAA